MKQNRNRLSYWLNVTAIGLIVGMSLQFAEAQWINPSATPPGGTIPAVPLTTGSVEQIRQAPINIKGGGAYGAGGIDFGFHSLNSRNDNWLYLGNEADVFAANRGLAVGNLSAINQICFGLDCRTRWETGTLTAGKWCTSDGSVINCNSDAPSGGGGGGIGGSGTANYLSKWTNGTTLGNSLLFDNGTQVGVGTASPDARLDIRATSGDPLHIDGAGANAIIRLQNNGSETAAMYTLSGQNDLRLRGVGNVYLDGGNASNGDLTVHSNGNIGVGTMTPGYKLDVNGTINSYAGGAYGSGGLRMGYHTLNSRNDGYLYLGDQNGSVFGLRGLAAQTLMANDASYATRFCINGGQCITGAPGNFVFGTNVLVNNDIVATGNVSAIGQLCINGDCRSTWPAGGVETDPQVGTLTNGRWCTTNGTSVNCTSNAPVATEVDPQVSVLQVGGTCTSNGAVVNCNTLCSACGAGIACWATRETGKSCDPDYSGMCFSNMEMCTPSGWRFTGHKSLNENDGGA